MEKIMISPIGTIQNKDGNPKIVLNKPFAPALTGLENFSHIQILWWFSRCDNKSDRNSLTTQSPYRNAPAILGTFATRSPMRPNPIALTCAQITHIDKENAEIGLTFLDAYDGTPILDIKPYTPSFDRVENPSVPAWCNAWPKSLEESADFDWESVFNFD